MVFEKFTKFSEHWSPKVIAQLNDYHVKIAKIQGDFVWHSHADTDELFWVIDGEMRIDFRKGYVMPHSGEICVVPKGIEHKPFAEQECQILMLEPAGTINTGDSGSDMTINEVPWI